MTHLEASSEELRPYLFSVAYRMLGVAADAEDAVQEAFLRIEEHPVEGIRSEKAMLTTVVTRICLDVLKSSHRKREEYIGPWLPEPVITEEPVDIQSISLAFLVLLERLSPEERAAYILGEVFEYSHDEIAKTLDKSEPAVRKLFSRAKQRLNLGEARFEASKEEHGRLVSGFLMACSVGDLSALRDLLTDDVSVTSDGGGKARAARRVVHGRESVAKLLMGFAKKGAPGSEVSIMDVNGAPSMVITNSGSIFTVVSIVVENDRISQVFLVRNPDKLQSMTRKLGLARATDITASRHATAASQRQNQP